MAVERERQSEKRFVKRFRSYLDRTMAFYTFFL